MGQPKPPARDSCVTSKRSITIPAGMSKNVLCEVITSDEWCAQPVLIESATSSRYIRENLMNEVNMHASPMSGAYDVKDNKEV